MKTAMSVERSQEQSGHHDRTLTKKRTLEHQCKAALRNHYDNNQIKRRTLSLSQLSHGCHS